MEVFMGHFFMYGSNFNKCLANLEKVLERCELVNLMLNWEKCHFMVKVGTIVRHLVSERGIEVDKENIEVKETMSPFTFVKEVRNFLGLKEALISAPIMQQFDWSLPFEIMCDASDFIVGAVFGQRKDKKVHAIHYASKTWDEAQVNYATTEKKLFIVVFTIDKFHLYLVGSKIIFYTDHAAIKYFLRKKDDKSNL
uniref:Uncharacterized protein LOC105851695 n=1 Tax=Cicer arietinum TaxID=3827 RepID=A0A1S3E0Z8_CICAR|nr:uncharacterized protein LOC105851695 [Cicer arietinum]